MYLHKLKPQPKILGHCGVVLHLLDVSYRPATWLWKHPPPPFLAAGDMGNKSRVRPRGWPRRRCNVLFWNEQIAKGAQLFTRRQGHPQPRLDTSPDIMHARDSEPVAPTSGYETMDRRGGIPMFKVAEESIGYDTGGLLNRGLLAECAL